MHEDTEDYDVRYRLSLPVLLCTVKPTLFKGSHDVRRRETFGPNYWSPKTKCVLWH